MQVEIRPLYPTDTQKFKTLRLESLKKDPLSWLATYEEEQRLSDFAFQSKIQQTTIQPIFGFYGYFENDKLLAYAQLSPSYWKKKRHIASLFDVCVAQEVRRQGVGKKLINYLIGRVKAIGYVEQLNLTVNSRNIGGIKFYESLGFQKVGTFPKFVKEPDGTYQDELLYSFKVK